ELKRKAHNIVRHPEMPEALYQNLWDNLKAGRQWMGLLKNRCKNGDYYWVNSYVSPVFENGRQVGYQSVRSQMTAEQKARATRLYQRMQRGAPALAWWSRPGPTARSVLFAMLCAAIGVA